MSKLINIGYGNVIITDTEKIVLSALLPETIAGRCEDREAKRQWEVKNEK